jgi:hypothetical protein
MAVTSCSKCGSQIPPGSERCPQCGHLNDNKASSKKIKGCAGIGGGCLALIIILFVIVACAAISSKPTESVMRSEVCTKLGTIGCGFGAVVEGFGIIKVTYHDYIFLSTLSVKISDEPEKTVAIGIFGNIFTGDARNNGPGRTR